MHTPSSPGNPTLVRSAMCVCWCVKSARTPRCKATVPGGRWDDAGAWGQSEIGLEYLVGLSN
jgi:hypothetical protein